MISKSKRIIAIGATTLGLVLGAGVFFTSAKGLSALSGKADETVNGSFSFDYRNNFVSKSGDVAKFRTHSSRSTVAYMISDNNYPNRISDSYKFVASFGSSSYASKYLSFYSDSLGETPFVFQNITSIDIEVDKYSDADASYEIFTKSDKSASVTGTLTKGVSNHITSVAGAKYLMFQPTSTKYLDIVSITVNYSCDPSGEPDPEPATLSSLTLSGGKNHFNQNEEFSFTGTATAHYSDLTSKVVTPTIKTAPNMSTIGITNAVLSYTEGDITVEANFRVQVGVYDITYLGFTGLEYVDLENVDLANSTMPAYAVPGSTVSVSVDVDDGYTLSFADTIEFEVTYSEVNNNAFTFTMPNDNVNVGLGIVPVIVRIEIDSNAPTTQNKGAAFTKPQVNAVYGNGYEVALPSADVEFDSDDYDMDTLGEYTVDVTYESFHTTYTFSVVEQGIEPADVSGTYKSEQTTGNTKYRSVIVLNGDGSTGKYILEKTTSGGDFWTYEMNISYSVDESDITITYVSLGTRTKYTGGPDGPATDYGTMSSLSTWFDPYRPFQGSSYISNSTSQIVSISSSVITMKRYSASTDSTGSSLTLTKQ